MRGGGLLRHRLEEGEGQEWGEDQEGESSVEDRGQARLQHHQDMWVLEGRAAEGRVEGQALAEQVAVRSGEECEEEEEQRDSKCMRFTPVTRRTFCILHYDTQTLTTMHNYSNMAIRRAGRILRLLDLGR